MIKLLTASGLILYPLAFPVSADQLAFGINNTGSLPNANDAWTAAGGDPTTSPSETGWYFTAPTTFQLSGVDTYFSPTPGGQIDRTVNLIIMTDRGVNGGTILGETSFDANSAIGQFGGGEFSTPISLTGGTQYFVVFQDVTGLGINTVCFPSVAGSNCGETVLTASYEANYSLQFPVLNSGGGPEGCYDLGCPSLEFFEPTPSTSASPEPSTFAFLAVALAPALAWHRRRQFKTLGK